MRVAIAIRIALLPLVIFCALAIWQWIASKPHVIASEALGSNRLYRIFNPGSAGPVIYAFDGDKLRHGLIPAITFSVAATLQAKPLPRIVAVDSDVDRDRDFRNVTSTPTDWRHDISGRADKFDTFLTQELIPEVEGSAAAPNGRYLMGHSLAGLYALDLSSRQPELFDGVFAFAPTISHDTSIIERLTDACRADTRLYANWGWESERDSAVFMRAANRWKSAENCVSNPPVVRHHYGAFHQIVMLTGQVEVAWSFLD